MKSPVPYAFVVLRQGVTLGVEGVKAHTQRHGPAHANPRHVCFIDEIRLAGTNKPDRKALIAAAEKAVRPAD